MREYVRDPAGRTLGFIEDIGVGTRIEARDVSGRLLAYYDKHLNQTLHPNGRVVGGGNLLPAFLVRR
jgi:hypothetical protein